MATPSGVVIVEGVMKTWLTAAFMTLVLMAAPARAQLGGPNADLVSQLSGVLGSTPEQAAGAAGAIFSFAKGNLNRVTWSQISAAIPGVDEMMHEVPARPDTAAPLPDSSFYGRGGSSLAGAFSRLGLSPDQVSKAAPVVTDYVSKVAGADLGKAFATALTQ